MRDTAGLQSGDRTAHVPDTALRLLQPETHEVPKEDSPSQRIKKEKRLPFIEKLMLY